MHLPNLELSTEGLNSPQKTHDLCFLLRNIIHIHYIYIYIYICFWYPGMCILVPVRTEVHDDLIGDTKAKPLASRHDNCRMPMDSG